MLLTALLNDIQAGVRNVMIFEGVMLRERAYQYWVILRRDKGDGFEAKLAH
jgi:hypothetical protein